MYAENLEKGKLYLNLITNNVHLILEAEKHVDIFSFRRKHKNIKLFREFNHQRDNGKHVYYVKFLIGKRTIETGYFQKESIMFELVA